MVVEISQPVLIHSPECSEITTYRLAGGLACTYSCREPDKNTGNEDSIALIPCGKASGVLAVADGMGGIPGGGKASFTVISRLAANISADNAIDPPPSLRDSLLEGLDQANQDVLGIGTGSATTIIALTIEDGVIRSYHAGDSATLVTGQRGKIKYLTIPHSPTGYGLESGLLDETDALQHDERHLISNVVGSTEMRVEIGHPLTLAKHDTVILGSDGLFDNLLTDEIVSIIRCGPLETCAETLASTCHSRMTRQTPSGLSKPDDIAFVIFRLA